MTKERIAEAKERASYPGHYISTACMHGKHEHCRKVDKWAGEPCQCDCGHAEVTAEPTYQALKERVQELELLLIVNVRDKDAIERTVALQAEEIEDLKGANLPLYSDRIRNMEGKIAGVKQERARAKAERESQNGENLLYETTSNWIGHDRPSGIDRQRIGCAA